MWGVLGRTVLTSGSYFQQETISRTHQRSVEKKRLNKSSVNELIIITTEEKNKSLLNCFCLPCWVEIKYFAAHKIYLFYRQWFKKWQTIQLKQTVYIKNLANCEKLQQPKSPREGNKQKLNKNGFITSTCQVSLKNHIDCGSKDNHLWSPVRHKCRQESLCYVAKKTWHPQDFYHFVWDWSITACKFVNLKVFKCVWLHILT